MALSSAMVWEVRTTGADTNGGGFKAGASGTDWSQQNAAQYSVTDGVTAGTTTITSATANFGTDVVGNLVYVQGGTGSVAANWYEITARNSATSITVDRSTGLTTGTGVTLKIGGALLSPSLAVGHFEAGHKCYVKYGTYTISSTSANVAGGLVQIGQNNIPFALIGYDTTRTPVNTDANRPTFQVAASGVTNVSIIQGGAADNMIDAFIVNILVDGQSKTGITAFTLTTGRSNYAINCKAINCTAGGFNGGILFWCEVSGGTTAHAIGTDTYCYYCYVHDCEVGPWGAYFRCQTFRCIADTITGIGFFLGTGGNLTDNCVAYNCTSHGFHADYGRGNPINCVAWLNGGYGFSSLNQLYSLALDNAGGSNTSGNVQGTIFADTGFVTLTADPFVDAANGNFALNTTAGGGAVLRAAGYPTYLDIGAVQHADPAATPVGHLNDAAANDALTALQSVFPATAVLDIYDAAAPADPDTAHSGTILVSFTLPGTPWGSPSAGVMAKNGTWSGTAGNTGTPVSARLRNAADSKRLDFTCTGTGGGGQVTLDVASITSGNTVTISTFTLTPA